MNETQCDRLLLFDYRRLERKATKRVKDRTNKYDLFVFVSVFMFHCRLPFDTFEYRNRNGIEIEFEQTSNRFYFAKIKMFLIWEWTFWKLYTKPSL